MLVRQAHQLAARERAEPTTAANAAARLRELQGLLGAMRFSGAFTGLEQICPPVSLAAMMREQAAGRLDALPPLLAPCLLAMGSLGRLDATAAPPPTEAASRPGAPAARPAVPGPGIPPAAGLGTLPGPGAGTAVAAGSAPSGPGPAAVAPRPAVAVTVELPSTAKRLTVSPAVPTQTDGAGPQFPATALTPQAGRLRLTLSDIPVYIEETPREAPPSPAERLRSPFGAHPATYRGEDPPFALARELGLGWHRGVAWWVDIQSDADLAAGRFDFSRLDAQLAAMGPGLQAMLTIMLPTRLRQDTTAGPAGPGLPGAGPGLGPAEGGAAPGLGAAVAGAGPGLGPAIGPGAAPTAGPGGPGLPAPPAVKADGSWALGPPLAAYDAFITALVTRYGLRPPAGVPRVSCWQFENELDLSRARNDAAGYAALLSRTARRIKSVDPKATVLAAGVSGEDFERNFQASYLPMLRALGGQGFDAFDLHAFGRAGDYKELAAMAAVARQALDATGFARTPIWLTETATYSGAPTAPPGLPPQTEADQAAELVRRGVFALSLGIRKVFWAMVREGFHFRNGVFDHVGLTTDARVSPNRPDGTPKAAFFTYRRLCAKLAGCEPRPERLALGPDVYAYRFRAPGGRAVIVAWADPGPPPPTLSR